MVKWEKIKETRHSQLSLFGTGLVFDFLGATQDHHHQGQDSLKIS
jgi:hypothetical protein